MRLHCQPVNYLKANLILDKQWCDDQVLCTAQAAYVLKEL